MELRIGNQNAGNAPNDQSDTTRSQGIDPEQLAERATLNNNSGAGEAANQVINTKLATQAERSTLTAGRLPAGVGGQLDIWA